MSKTIRRHGGLAVYLVGAFVAVAGIVTSIDSARAHDWEWMGYGCEQTGCDPADPNQDGICCHDDETELQ